MPGPGRSPRRFRPRGQRLRRGIIFLSTNRQNHRARSGGLLLLLLYAYGVRVSEVCGIYWRDVRSVARFGGFGGGIRRLLASGRDHLRGDYRLGDRILLALLGGSRALGRAPLAAGILLRGGLLRRDVRALFRNGGGLGGRVVVVSAFVRHGTKSTLVRRLRRLKPAYVRRGEPKSRPSTAASQSPTNQRAGTTLSASTSPPSAGTSFQVADGEYGRRTNSTAYSEPR